MTTYCVEYSRSSRATCIGPAPCHGSSILVGSLRYGETTPSEFGDTVQWRHWGCVTPDILDKLASISLNKIVGFQNIAPVDQEKIRTAIAARHIDPADIPASAKVAVYSQAGSVSGPEISQRKRKAALASSQPPFPSAPRFPLTLSQPSSLQDDEDDEVDMSAAESCDELYCMMSTSVVGIQYYKGLVGAGEEIKLIREPHNVYDRNAIQVKNIGNVQVGHLPRNVASKLAPLLDSNLVTVEGVMNVGNLESFSYSLATTLKIYGASDKRDQLERLLIWATPQQRGFPPRGSGSNVPQIPGSSSKAPTPSTARLTDAVPSSSQRRSKAGASSAQSLAQQEAGRKQQEALQKAAELRQMLNSLEKVDDEGRRNSLLDTLCSVDDILNLPVHPSPPGIESGDLVVDLLKHQSQALQWCIEHEYPVLPKKETDRPVQFWQLRKTGNKTYYYNIATKTPQEAAPPLGRGALCADSMGLGKTLTMLALILATKNYIPAGFSRTTLIVVPLSVLSNWEKQIEDHCTPGALTSCVYYGTKRSMTVEQLQQYDVVITTYQTVTGEHIDPNESKGGEPVKKKKKTSRGLFDVQWKRIILDEGHNIRNPGTKSAKAVCALDAQRRWVLSGTPIINSPRDLGSILTFLRICQPLDNQDFYKRLLLRPLKDGDPAGAELLRALMSHICIRRTKEMQDSEGNRLVPLPPVEIIVVPVKLHDEARALYDAVDTLSKQRIENFMNKNGGINSVVQSNVLSMLTRLRQLALHPGLVPRDYLEQLQTAEADEDASTSIISVTPQERIRLQGLLAQAIEDNEECPICFNILMDARVTSCAHPFCFACISEVISRDPKCPMDRRPINLGDLIEPPPPTDLTQAPVRREVDDSASLPGGSSAKIDQLIHLLKLTPAFEKSLVFSQFTSFLDKIAEALDEHGIAYVRFDGQMSAKRRQEALQKFSIPVQEETSLSQEISIPSQRRRRSRQVVTDDGDASFNDETDADFVVDTIEADDDDFLDDNDNDGTYTAMSHKGKNKVKDKGKSKMKAAKSTGRANGHGSFEGPLFTGENPKVMLISLKAGAFGLNLTVASNVYLMDPWWQEGIESQAIDRCNRIGQKRPVHVYQLIAENTVESKVIEIQERKKLLIQQAFSGIKRPETKRQKREARLQDLIELFGVRQAASQAM